MGLELQDERSLLKHLGITGAKTLFGDENAEDFLHLSSFHSCRETERESFRTRRNRFAFAHAELRNVDETETCIQEFVG